MRVLVTGAAGMVGAALTRQIAERGWTSLALSRADLDITDARAVDRRLEALQPDAVINAAAYTAVDAAEQDEVGATRANRDGPALLARACGRLGIPLVHLSTDYVFDGGQRVPYRPADAPAPLNVYGRTKLAGEEQVRAATPRHLIVRTSWALSRHGKNFVRTVLRLAEQDGQMRIVADQRGSPTSGSDLAHALLDAVARCTVGDCWGTYHFANAGEASWFELAEEILRLHLTAGDRASIRVRPVTSAEFGAAARRPLYSVLDTGSFTEAFGVAPRPWREALADELAGAGR